MPPARTASASAASAARLVLVERRDTPATRDPYAAPIRRYRLARTQLAGRSPVRDARLRTPGRSA
jgi:hypothetical protein